MTPRVAEALRSRRGAAAAVARARRGDLPRSDGRQGDGGAEGRDPARHRDAGRDGRRDRRRGRGAAGADDAASTAAGQPLLDTCGPGGLGRDLFNVSTATAIVAAGAGASVAKHGNRSITSRVGSADVLAACGVTIEIDAADGFADSRRCGPRLSLRAVLSSGDEGARHGPPRARSSDDLQRARAARQPGRRLAADDRRRAAGARAAARRRARAASAASARSSSMRRERARRARARRRRRSASRSGRAGRGPGATIPARCRSGPSTLAELAGSDAAGNAAMLRALLEGEPGPRRETVLLNAALALVVEGRAQDLRDGYERARDAVDRGSAASASSTRCAIASRRAGAGRAAAHERTTSWSASSRPNARASGAASTAHRPEAAARPDRTAPRSSRPCGSPASASSREIKRALAVGRGDPAGRGRSSRDDRARVPPRPRGRPLGRRRGGPLRRAAGLASRARRGSRDCPCSMKDFVVSEQQLDFAASLGADAVLLIVRALSDDELSRARRRVARPRSRDRRRGARRRRDRRRAAAVRPDVLGVNARDLGTFRTDLARPRGARPELPAGPVRLAESGIRIREDVARLRAAGYRRVSRRRDPAAIRGSRRDAPAGAAP